MKREELQTLGLTDEQINSVMKLNGDDINREKSKFADYDAIKQQLEKANATIDGMKLELQAKIKDFTSDKKFVNDLTRDAINAQLESALNDDANKGKSLDDLLKALTDGKDDIFREENTPTPPHVPGMTGDKGTEDGVTAAFKALNPTLNI